MSNEHEEGMSDKRIGVGRRMSETRQAIGDAMTSAAGQFGPTGHDHTILRRYDVQPLALIAANLKKDAFAGRAAGFSGHQGFDDTRQMLWQLATIGSALSSSLLACFGVGTSAASRAATAPSRSSKTSCS